MWMRMIGASIALVSGSILCSCSSEPADNRIVVSRIHGICATATGASLKHAETGPDFDSGAVVRRESEVEYYSGTSPSYIERLKVATRRSDEFSRDGIEAHEVSYSDGNDAISLTGYPSRFDARPSVKVQYRFKKSDAGSRSLAAQLAQGTQTCLLR